MRFELINIPYRITCNGNTRLICRDGEVPLWKSFKCNAFVHPRILEYSNLFTKLWKQSYKQIKHVCFLGSVKYDSEFKSSRNPHNWILLLLKFREGFSLILNVHSQSCIGYVWPKEEWKPLGWLTALIRKTGCLDWDIRSELRFTRPIWELQAEHYRDRFWEMGHLDICQLVWTAHCFFEYL